MNQENAFAELVTAEVAKPSPPDPGATSFPMAAALRADSDAELISEARLYLVAMGALFSDT